MPVVGYTSILPENKVASIYKEILEELELDL